MKSFSSGSIRKHRKYNGDWEWQGFLIVTENGKRRQLTKMTGIECTPPRPSEKNKRCQPTGKGAKLALEFAKNWRDELVAIDASAPSIRTDESVLDFTKRYIESRDIEPSTLQGYRFLLPYIEMLDMPITALTPAIAEQWKTDMQKANIGPHMRRKAFNLLKYACNWGVSLEILNRNALAAVKAPPQPKHEPNPLDPKHLPHLIELLEACRSSKPEFSDMCLLALNTGMRRGELCALRWCDIDNYEESFSGCAHVNHVIAHKDGGTYIKNYPKNGNRRIIDINGSIKTILERRKAAMAHLSTDLANCYVFGFPASPDVYPAPSYISKLWGMFAGLNQLAGVEGDKLRFHDLRDTFATSALVNGIPVATVAAILGHANPNTTYKHYSHFIPSKNKEAMDFIGGVLNATAEN